MATINFRDSPEKEKRRLQNQQRQDQRKEQSRSTTIEQGRKAWGNWERTRSAQLELGDRQTIAKCLGKKIEAIKEKDGRGALTKLLQNVMYLAQPMTLKHLSKLTIKPGAKAEKDLAAAPAPYQALIQALAQYTGEELYVLADEMLLFTPFHPVGKAQLEEAQLMLDALQVAVDRIDREFNLWEQCQAVAAIREPLEEPYHQALRDGDEPALSAFYDAHPFHVRGDPIKLWWPIEGDVLDDQDGKPFAPVNAFWAKSFDSDGANAACVWSGEEIFFFPHVYLGPAVEWIGWREYVDGGICHDWVIPTPPSDAGKVALLTGLQSEAEPRVRFDEETINYQVYEEGPAPGEVRLNGTDWDWGGLEHMDSVARWLVIYPDPDAKRLVPAMYTRGVYSFTQLVPLSARLIAEFGDDSRWQYIGQDAPTLLQRLKDLTGFGTGDFKVIDAWRETAARFHLNPIFRSHPGEDKKILYRRHLEKWIAENRCPADSHEDE